VTCFDVASWKAKMISSYFEHDVHVDPYLIECVIPESINFGRVKVVTRL
jgi:hypothetical protein